MVTVSSAIRIEVFLGLLAICHFNTMAMYQSLFFWIGYPIVSFVRHVLANIFASKRPYMFSDSIDASCGPSYGAPDQKCMVASFLIVAMYLQKYYEIDEAAMAFESVMCTGYIIKMFVTAFLFAFTFVLCMSQLYIGQASYDQILLGLMLGTYLAIFLHQNLKYHLKYLPLYLAQPRKVELFQLWREGKIG